MFYSKSLSVPVSTSVVQSLLYWAFFTEMCHSYCFCYFCAVLWSYCFSSSDIFFNNRLLCWCSELLYRPKLPNALQLPNNG